MGVQHAADFKDLQDAAGALDIAARDLRLVVSEDFAKLPGQAVTSRDGFDEVYADAQEKLSELIKSGTLRQEIIVSKEKFDELTSGL
jgi:hypothetical protein